MGFNRQLRELKYITFLVVLGLAQAGGACAATAKVTAAASHGLSLNATGVACGAGENAYGVLGDGTAVDRLTPVPVVNLYGTISAISTGQYHTAALKTDGTVWTWGYNGYGELGTGNNTDRLTPFSVPNLTGVLAVAVGQYHTLALKSDGTVWAWGYNGNGQLGDGTTTGRTTPVQVLQLQSQLQNVVSIAAGQDFSLALKSDGTVWAWGYNGNGQLGDGTAVQRPTPVQVTALSGVVEIAAGLQHAIARKSDGTVWTWGYGGYGQLGNGSNSSQSNIVSVSGITTATAIDAGDNHSLAVLSNGTVWAWGNNDSGQLGDGTTTRRNVPVQTGAAVNGFAGLSAVAGGAGFSLALQVNGTVWAWGDNAKGQFGDGITNQSFFPIAQSACAGIPTPNSVVPSSFITHISANQKFTLVAKSDGTVSAWGDNANGQLGDGTLINRNTPVQASGVTGARDVSAGGFHSLAVTAGGSVWSWGYNGYGELGNGTNTNRPTPLPLTGFTGAVAAAGGAYHSLVLKSDGTVWGFGYNGYGNLGDGTMTSRTSPVLAIGLGGVTAIAAGQYHSLALKSDGTVWAWGNNASGQLGDGTNTTRQSAVQVPGLTNILAIAAGQNHSFALRSDGTVWAWGYGGYGQLGDGSTATEYNIVRVSGLTNVIAIAAGANHGLAVTSDRTVWAWGNNDDGELGNGTTTRSTVPVQVTGVTGALAVAAGANYSLVLRSDGSIYDWGTNDQGQFGVPTPSSSTVSTAGPLGRWVTTFTLTTGVSPPNSGAITVFPASTGLIYETNATVCLIAGPAAGQIFTGWSGAALNAANCLTMTGDESVAANFTPSTGTPLRFIPAAPCRVADTRVTGGPLGAGATRNFTVQGTCGIPAGALAYSLNLTVVPNGTLGYVSMWPTGQSQPVVSTLNSPDGRVKSNAAIVPAGTGGAVSVYATNGTNVILDVNGYFDASTDPSALAFYPLTPCRVADTRIGSGALGGPSLLASQSRIFPVLSSVCGIPGNALAYSLNFTAVPQGPLGYLTVWPSGQSQPVVSTLNAPTAAITANAAIVPAGTGGAIDLFVTNNTDMIIDINGYFAAPASGGYSLYNLTPCRIVDTRLPAGVPGFTGTIAVTATGVPCGVPPEARALVLNATAVPSGALGYLSLWANGGSQPVVSTLNALDGSITSNMAGVPTTNGFVNAYAAGPGPTYLILDISGYFAP